MNGGESVASRPADGAEVAGLRPGLKKATGKSVVAEMAEIKLAASMIELGARLQILLSETSLSRERLSRLYRELRSELPPKGMLPFSVDWHMTWMPNIHSSVFYDIYQFMLTHADWRKVEDKRGVEVLVDAYRAYVEHMYAPDFKEEPVLSFTRAWMMIRFFDADMLQMRRCETCGGRFVAYANDLGSRYVCGLCHLPPRAGKRLGTSRRHRRSA